ncbi:MAG: hypothetical protein MSK40_05165 [Parabacteroides sp.]|nr:hypothetical protein [Parabacteroides sp.]
MASLTFNKVGEIYQVDFTANSDYALHIEREREGRFFIKQRTGSNGEYADCALPPHIGNGGKVMDYTFSHGVYPMNVRLISETPVTIAERQEAQ